jgi:tetratricopeptide (TPR) repeat protein
MKARVMDFVETAVRLLILLIMASFFLVTKCYSEPQMISPARIAYPPRPGATSDESAIECTHPRIVEAVSANRQIAVCSALIRSSPRSSAAYNNRGAAFLELGDISRAISDLNEAIQLDPNNESAAQNLGIAWSKKGDFDHAIKYFTRVIASSSFSTEALAGRGSLTKV